MPTDRKATGQQNHGLPDTEHPSPTPWMWPDTWAGPRALSVEPQGTGRPRAGCGLAQGRRQVLMD